MSKLTIVVDDADGTIAAPTPGLATAGVPLWMNSPGQKFQEGFPTGVDEIEIGIRAHRSGGVALILPAPRVWLFNPYLGATGEWMPAGTGAVADKGRMNDGVDLAEQSANLILHSERWRGIREFTRIAIEQPAPSAGTCDDYDVIAFARSGVNR